MKPFSKKSDLAQPTPPGERGSQEISKFDPEYIFLLKLIKVVTAAGVPPQEIKALAEAFPFVTVDDVGDLAAKIWTLATQKYGIPSDWLTSKLPKNASLKVAAPVETTDLTQFALDDKQIRQHFESRGLNIADVVGSLPNFAIKYINKDHEKKDPSLKDNTNGFYDYNTGILYINPRLSVDDKRITIIHEIEHAIQDSVGMLPVHSPEDLKQVQRTPYLERTFEMGARQQQFNALKARGMSLEEIEKYWIKRYKVPEFAREEVHNEIEQYNELSEEMMPGSLLASKKANKTYDDEWQAQKETEDMLDHAPGYLAYDYGQDKTADDEGFKGSDFSGTDADPNPVIDNGPFSSPQDQGAKDQIQPFPNTDWVPADDKNEDEEPYSDIAAFVEKPFSKKADLSGQVVNTILNDIHSSGTATYNLINGDMQGTHNFAISAYPERTQSSPEGIDFDVIEKYLLTNEDLLKDSNNAFRAVLQNGQVQLQIVATVPDRDKAVEFAREHNQPVIFDLLSNQDIPTDSSNKTAEENVLSQGDQDEIAAATSPVYNIALNNYAEAVKRGHSKDRSIAYAVESVKNIEKIDEKTFVGLINNYLTI